MDKVETWDGPFHKRKINKGEYGTVGKIIEELEEALDAVDQNQMLMLLIECSDILGAVVGALLKQGIFQSEDDAYEHLQATTFPDSFSTIVKVRNLHKYLVENSEEPLTLDRACEIVNVALGLAALRGIEFSELQIYAQLRSEVARYAINKAEGNICDS